MNKGDLTDNASEEEDAVLLTSPSVEDVTAPDGELQRSALVQRSNSVLLTESDEEEDHEEHPRVQRKRQTSMQYMQDASMEAALMDASSDSATATNRPVRLSPSGSQRKRAESHSSSASDNDIILVHPPSEQETASSSLDFSQLNGGSEDEAPRPSPRSSFMNASHRDVFQVPRSRSSGVGSSAASEHDKAVVVPPIPPPSGTAITRTSSTSSTASRRRRRSPVPAETATMPPRPQLSTVQVLKQFGILTETDPLPSDQKDETLSALYWLLGEVCTPSLSMEVIRSVLVQEQERAARESQLPSDATPGVDYAACSAFSNAGIPWPAESFVVNWNGVSRISQLLSAGVPTAAHGPSASSKQQSPVQTPALLQLPLPVALAVMRILVRLVTYESDQEYNHACFIDTSWKNAQPPPAFSEFHLISDDPPTHADHVTKRPHVLYSMARFQCAWAESQRLLAKDSSGGGARNNNDSRQMAQQAERPPLVTLLNLFECVVMEDRASWPLLAPVARLLGLLGTAGVTPLILWRMLALSQSSALSPLARLCLIRAMTTAAVGAGRYSHHHKAAPPRRFFGFFGSQGLRRTINGLAAWPFRNDFGMAVWFRAEQFYSASRLPVLLSARTDDGGGVQVSLVPLGDNKDEKEAVDACTLAVSVYDSGRPDPAHRLKVSGCVLLPRVWYHVAVRHTRSRLKGVFSLSTRQQVSILLDGKTMLTESLPFPKIVDTDFKDDLGGPSSILQTGLRRATSHASINLTIEFGTNLDGQTGALYLFNDNVSDASLRALYGATGEKGEVVRRVSSTGVSWDQRRSDIVKKSRVLDVNITNDDAEDIVLSQRRPSGSKRPGLDETHASVVDLEGDEPEEGVIPVELQKAAFGSKIFLVWDPRRVVDSLALELHIGAHVTLDGVYSWIVNGAQDAISSVGGIQALIPVFRSMLLGDVEKTWLTTNSSDKTESISGKDAVLSAIPDLISLLSAFVQFHSISARELLRCGGIDVIEQVLFASKKVACSKPNEQSLFGAMQRYPCLAFQLVESLLGLRAGSSHYVGLETKVFSRLLFNLPLWICGLRQLSGVSLITTLLPVFSTLTHLNSEKVRDCVGVKDMVYTLKEYSSDEQSSSSRELDRFFGGVDSNEQHLSFSKNERQHACDILLSMIFEVLASGVSPLDLGHLLNFISLQLDIEFEEASRRSQGDIESFSADARSDRLRVTARSCAVVFFLLQIRPVISGLFDSFAVCCGSVHGGVGWLLSAMVNTFDDEIRSFGIRCAVAYLDVASQGPDVPLSLGTPVEATEDETPAGLDMPASVRRASKGFTLIAKGLAAMGPGVRSIVVTPSKLTARVAYKLLFGFLKSHRLELGNLTHAALLHCITEDKGMTSAPLSSLDFLLSQLDFPDTMAGQDIRSRKDWTERILSSSSGSTIGRSLDNPLAISTLLRLLRFFDGDRTDEWVSELLSLTKENRRSVSLLSSIPDWQHSLFLLLSDTLEQNSQARSSIADGASERTDSTGKRLDSCLELYSSLLGHLIREGGDKALTAVENVAAHQRVCVNGHDVLLLILSSLCLDLYEHGTILEIGAISAQAWKGIDLDHDSLLLKQSARLVTDAILSNGTKGLDMTSAVRSWRSLRHLTEIIVAVVTKCGLGIVDLFDYSNQKASAVDDVSGGLNGIRLSDSSMSRIGASDYSSFKGHSLLTSDVESFDERRGLDRRMCVMIAAQVLTLLDAFIFPDALDESLPASQMHGLALVRNSEPRLGSSQGPLVSSAIRLSLLLLALLEPCSVKFLQCASRLRCLLYWTLELLREMADLDTSSPVVKEGIDSLERLILAIVLHCHRALGRCTALLSEIESSAYEKYFTNREAQKKHSRRLLRAALELRDIVSTAYRGRNEMLRTTLSTEAYEALRSSLEGSSTTRQTGSKESVVRDFMSSKWVAGFQDVEMVADLAIPEQVAMETIPLSSNPEGDPALRGFFAVERLAQESSLIVRDFEKSLDVCFERYLEAQRKWAETDAVRELEFDGDTVVKRLSEKHKTDAVDTTKALAVRRFGADNRWRGIYRSSVEPWMNEAHWMLARYTDLLGRRILFVQNRQFNNHRDAGYELALGRDSGETEEERQELEQKELSEVMRRNAEAFIVHEEFDDLESRDDDSALAQASDGDSSTDVESMADGDSTEPTGETAVVKSKPSPVDEFEPDEGWDKIETADIQVVDIDAWAKAFIWSENESVIGRFEPVVIVTLQSFVEGKLLLTTHGLYFHQMGGEVNAITKEHVENTANGTAEAKDRRWRLSRLTEIHGRRFMLRPQALELFFSDSHELFLNFPGGSKERDRFHAKLRNSSKVPLLWSPKSLNPRTVFRKSRLTELWKKRKISNFHYLMALNRMAGRSFNDITQYPVFPWVLADYTSETIDLTDSRIYRDLSKPVGALNPDRLAQLLERYSELELMGFSEAEKFLYGSHYSSPGIILHYLIRQEPFTTMAIDLQSGRFDCPDRLFFDVGSSWNSCLTSTSDMKELIPEFFCLPEMFLNTNKFPLGRTQTGRSIDNVGLPPWAKGSAYEFVRIHRQALESDYVSQNLNHWIDLIFGYKQRGPESEAAHNIFHHLSYEGSVDLDKITDELDRKAAESHIQNFGQTPSQLTATDPHPERSSAESCWKPLIYSASVPENLRCYTPSKQFGNKRSEYAKGCVLKIHVMSDTIFVVYEDMSVGTYRFVPGSKSNRLRMGSLRPLARRELSSSRIVMKRGSAVPAHQMQNSALSMGNYCIAVTIGGVAKEELRRKAIMPPSRLISTSETTLATAEASALLVSCGYWDNTVKIHTADGWRTVASESGGHRGGIRCLAVGRDGGLMITGGQDGTCRIWVVDHPDMAIALSDGYVQTALGASNDGEQLLSCCHVLWGHESPVTCVDLDSDLDLAVSGSQLGVVYVHTIRRGDFVRSLRPPALSQQQQQQPSSAVPVSKLALDTTGTMAISMEDGGLHTFTVNGVRLCSVDAGEKLNDMLICSSGEILVTGGDRCQVFIRRSADLQVLSMLDLTRHGPIRCIAMTPDDLNPVPQFLFVGTEDGMITIIDQDAVNRDKDTETITF